MHLTMKILLLYYWHDEVKQEKQELNNCLDEALFPI